MASVSASMCVKNGSKNTSSLGAATIYDGCDLNGRHVFLDSGGVRLHALVWRPSVAKAQMILIHGLESNSAWFSDLGPRLAAKGYLVAAVDRPGSGLSGGRRGDMIDFAVLADHVRAVSRHIGEQLPAYVLGFSWGARCALAHARRYPGDFRAIIVMAPGFRLRKPYSLLTRLYIAAAACLHPSTLVRTPTAADESFTTRAIPLQFIRSDRQRISRVTARMLLQSWKIDRLLFGRGSAVAVPLLHLIAGRDQICHNRHNSRLLRRLFAPADYTELVYPDADHALVFECDRYDVAGDIDGWVESVESGGTS